MPSQRWIIAGNESEKSAEVEMIAPERQRNYHDETNPLYLQYESGAYRTDAHPEVAHADTERLPAGARLLPPCSPTKIVCVGRNYAEHAKELGNEVPKEPLIFLKPPSSLIASGDEIVYPALSQRVDFEGELGVVIGKRARNVAAARCGRTTYSATPASTMSPPAICSARTDSGRAAKASTHSAPWPCLVAQR